MEIQRGLGSDIVMAFDECPPYPATPEQVNHLFRVFHTIKGVSAFLGAEDVKGLAHVTETLLGRIRDGARRARGRP